ncbi:MAG: hypothetical protein QXU20_04800 [Candidatus Woesearchaeota archaeon]
MKHKLNKLNIVFISVWVITLIFLAYILFVKKSQQKNTFYTIKHEAKTKEQKYNDLNKIAISAQLNYVKQFLGEPAFKNFQDNQTTAYIFVDPDYYVELITDNNENIIALRYHLTQYQISADSFSLWNQSPVGKNSLLPKK